MKNLTKGILIIVCVALLCGCLTGCADTNDTNIENTDHAVNAAYNVIENQPAPQDIDYSLERYNVIRRAYWVNGQREKANALVCGATKPLGYIVLFAESGAVVGRFVVDGKVSSLNSYLFPAYIDVTSDGFGAVATYHAARTRSTGTVFSVEIPGIDGTYGSNAGGIFFFTVSGAYLEWTGDYLYTDIPVSIEDPVVHFEESVG